MLLHLTYESLIHELLYDTVISTFIGDFYSIEKEIFIMLV